MPTQSDQEVVGMDGVIGSRVLRCPDGHLFTSTESARLFRSVHLGPKRFMRCPVDGRWRVMSNVDSRTLDPSQQAEAAQYRT